MAIAMPDLLGNPLALEEAVGCGGIRWAELHF